MSNTARIAATAANTLTKPLNVEEVFSTYLYTGNSSTQTITNGIDLDGEGGLVWGKRRNSTQDHFFFDTERGIYNYIESNTSNAQQNDGNAGVVAFNTNGFDIKSYLGQFNSSGSPYTSWTWRKAPKFFDCVQYTGDGVAGREIAHSLDANVGFMVIKRVDSINNWVAWHRLATSGSSSGALYLNATNATFASTTTRNFFGDGSTTIDPTSSVFTVASNAAVNASGGTYVAYLFAHNDGDGEFGPDADADIIKCGSFTTTSTGIGSVDIGFEPQWMLIKSPEITSNWFIADNMRGWSVPTGSTDTTMQYLLPHTSAAEGDTYLVDPTATGFDYRGAGGSREYIYIAIRRGPMAVPESATDVFDVNLTTSNQFVTTGFPVDLQLGQYTGAGSTYVVDRLRGMSTSTTGSMKYLTTQSTNAEASNSGTIGFNGFVQNGFSHTLGNFEQALWSWRRAPNYFDVVAYTGDGTAGRTVSHNLGVAPEMIWVKNRSTGSRQWRVYHTGLTSAQYYLELNSNQKEYGLVGNFNSTDPTESVFTLGTAGQTNTSGDDYIAYLFATVDGVSKVGSYTGNGTNQTIDCGFSSGARFVLIKRTDSTGDWYVWDTERGIVAGNDPHLSLNTTAAEVTSNDSIDPANSGFIVNQVSATNINVSSANYIFYAIA